MTSSRLQVLPEEHKLAISLQSMVQKHITAALYDKNVTVTAPEKAVRRHFKAISLLLKIKRNAFPAPKYSVHRKVFSRTFSILLKQQETALPGMQN